jgi:ribose transport system ATP-binding protein
MGEFTVRPPRPDAAFATFSGGNQQKALLAKWLRSEPRVLLLHEPVQGVDVGAKRQIFEHIRNAASNGVAVLIVSEEHEDLAHLCDRVLIFRDGRVAAELAHGQISAGRIVERCFSTESRVVPAHIDGTARR